MIAATLGGSVTRVAGAAYSSPSATMRTVGLATTFLYHWLSDPVTGSRSSLSASRTNHTGRVVSRPLLRPVTVRSISFVPSRLWVKDEAMDPPVAALAGRFLGDSLPGTPRPATSPGHLGVTARV